MKKCWFQQKSRSVSRDLYKVFGPSLGNLKLQSFIIVGFVWQILDGEGRVARRIREQSQKGPSWIELKLVKIGNFHLKWKWFQWSVSVATVFIYRVSVISLHIVTAALAARLKTGVEICWFRYDICNFFLY